ncbi:hypothetical protein [Halorussus aquaticus]|uniref:Big-1 domain-containing protein n=1 Tax=Halorussus aquaticus TaxID=2953748 RepID=A0ABD5Q4R7_9EURY|nr:hypothetical protein [Halorussus aquaticus]
MRLRIDDRGVTVQIGTVLLFAVLIVLLSTYQASVVPQQNEQVEFNHNQQVQSQLQDLRDELLRTAATGSGGSASVALGTQYPVRAFFVNPAPPSGTLATTPEANFTIQNATAVGETGDYWTGESRNFSTKGLTYDPLYHVYQNPPTTVYGNGVLYNRFPDANRTLSNQRLVRGNQISLVALNGTLSKSSSGTATIDLRAVSTATRTVTIRNETANLSVIVPTRLPEGRAVGLWRQLLADERSRSPGDDRRVLAVEEGPSDSIDDVRIVLEPGTYELELAKVGVGSDATGVEPHYVTDVRGDNASVPPGGRQKVVVEVRDRFNNPVSGTTVNVTGVSDGSVTPSPPGRVETGSDGRATFVYEAPSDPDVDTVSVEVEIGDGSEPRERANVRLQIDQSGTDESDEYDVNWDDWGDELDCSYTPCRATVTEKTTIPLTATVTAETGLVSNATLDYAVNDTSVGWTSLTSGVTDGNGRNTTTLTVRPTNDTVTVYAASGDDVEPLDVRVVNPDGDGGEPSLSSSVVDQGQTGSEARYEVSYEIRNTENFDHVEVTFDNLDSSGADQTYTSEDPRTNIDDYGWADSYGGTGGDTYNITIEVYDTAGNVVDSRRVTDDADGTDPSGNTDLSEFDSPTLESTSLSDTTQFDNANYELTYEVSDPAGKFTETEVLFRNEDAAWATGQKTGTARSQTVSYSAGGTGGDRYTIIVQVQDDDGIVVDRKVITDVADGSSDSPGSSADLQITRTARGPGNSGDTYEFDASGSTGDVAEYRWDFDNDGTIDRTTSNPVVSTEQKPNRVDRGRVVVVRPDGSTDEATASYPN